MTNEQEYPYPEEHKEYRCNSCGEIFKGHQLYKSGIRLECYGHLYSMPCGHHGFLIGSDISELPAAPPKETDNLTPAEQKAVNIIAEFSADPSEDKRWIISQEVWSAMYRFDFIKFYSHIKIGDKTFRARPWLHNRAEKTYELRFFEMKTRQQLAAEGKEPYDLTKMPTRRLLGMLHEIQRRSGRRSTDEGWYAPYSGDVYPTIPATEIKDELAKREHIPRTNKTHRKQTIAERKQAANRKGKRDR